MRVSLAAAILVGLISVPAFAAEDQAKLDFDSLNNCSLTAAQKYDIGMSWPLARNEAEARYMLDHDKEIVDCSKVTLHDGLTPEQEYRAVRAVQLTRDPQAAADIVAESLANSDADIP